MADNSSLANAAIIDELASIIERVADLMELATSGLDDTPDAEEVAARLRRMDRHKDAEELEALVARAEELRSASSDSS